MLFAVSCPEFTAPSAAFAYCLIWAFVIETFPHQLIGCLWVYRLLLPPRTIYNFTVAMSRKEKLRKFLTAQLAFLNPFALPQKNLPLSYKQMNTLAHEVTSQQYPIER